MAQVKLYYRAQYKTLVLIFSNGASNSARHSLPIHIEPNQWDGERIINHPRAKEMNLHLTGIITKARVELMRIQESEPTKHMPASVLRDKIVSVIFADGENSAIERSFEDVMEEFSRTHANARTREIYSTTLARIREYEPNEHTFEEITKRWLDDFDQHLSKQSPSKNARAIHLRNIRAVFNYAIDNDLTELYPFRRYKIQREDTIHRDLTLPELKRLFSYQPPTERPNKHHSKPLDYAVKYIDVAKLIFYLVGINIIDLCHLTPADYYGGRIHYKRAKTGTIYDIKVEPEAAAIIEKYQGEHKLLSICEPQSNYKYFAAQVNKALRKISKEMGLPQVTMYWLRHSWATIAYTDARIPLDTIKDALGHQNGPKVTLGYVDKLRAMKLCEEANRKVIDLIIKEG